MSSRPSWPSWTTTASTSMPWPNASPWASALVQHCRQRVAGARLAVEEVVTDLDATLDD